MKIIGIGDNVVDYYKHQNLIYPGGNALNVAVMAKRNGASKAAFLGIFGNDSPSKHIISSLKQEEINIERSRYAIGECGEATISIEEGDRVFIGSNRRTRIESLLRINLQEDDIDYINQYDIVHTSINSKIETELEKISHKTISYDFSDKNKWNEELISKIAPNITYAFFSGSDLEEAETFKLIDFVHQFDVSVVGVTRGEKSAIFSIEGEIFKQDPLPTNLIDTMGAGDSFIAGFLSTYGKEFDPKLALYQAAKSASITCSHFGAIGYPKEKK
ncbi:PfkB family carbohydrate kinase [Pseudogracilibacillus sp. SE30717A]|uniref:PfkB family carbohydrate kinase n=1 Tax=Pseudogracilibacillus sp. SE30717A TaxID=3098293 RepID=UPI00300DE19A